jgi:hypothetical protein
MTHEELRRAEYSFYRKYVLTELKGNKAFIFPGLMSRAMGFRPSGTARKIIGPIKSCKDDGS